MGFFSSLFRKRDTLGRPSAEAASQSGSWPFDQSPNTAAITTRQVLDGEEEIHVVVHYADDHAWAFLCGTTDAAEDGRVVPMRDIVAIDESVLSIADLPAGSKAWRERRGAAWQKAENGRQV